MGFLALLEPYRLRVEEALTSSIESFGPPTRLREAVLYALQTAGKRFRPAIVLMVAQAIGKNEDALPAALAVEFFHTASLIADDLPCMDNDQMRRGTQTLHVAFDEATAILATYALISAGYDQIRINAKNSPEKGMLAFENVTHNTGIWGATGGQFNDLFLEAPTREAFLDLIDKKTGTLFEISFVLGWLFGGGEIEKLSLVKKTALHLGRAFQLSDDFLDIGDGAQNVLTLLGREEAFSLFEHEMTHFKKCLQELCLESPELLSLLSLIEERVS